MAAMFYQMEVPELLPWEKVHCGIGGAETLSAWLANPEGWVGGREQHGRRWN